MDAAEAAADGVRETRAAATRIRRQAAAAAAATSAPRATTDAGPAQEPDVELDAGEGIPAARAGFKRRRAPMSRSRASSLLVNHLRRQMR